jgi:hypothetical protein
VKVSGQYFRGDEWSYLDDSELVEREKFDSNREFWRNDLMRATGVGADEADRRIDRISARNFDIERWSGEVRADWALSEAATAVFTAGVANAGRQIELTGLGPPRSGTGNTRLFRLASGRTDSSPRPTSTEAMRGKPFSSGPALQSSTGRC